MPIALQFLGGLEVIADGREMDDLRNRPVCSALLVYIATEHGVTRDSAVAVLWPERSEARARHALSQALYQLRKILGAGCLKASGQQLRLARDVRVDVSEFSRLVDEGSSLEAVKRYGGRFLGGWHLGGTTAFQHWADRKSEQLASRFRTACRRGIAESLEAGDKEQARTVAQRWVEVEPAGSEAHRELIRLLVEDGELDAAREIYASLETRLADAGVLPPPDVAAAIAPAQTWLPAHGPSRSHTAHPERILVLPFAHAGPPEYAHLTDGLTDETTIRLSRHRDLAVISRSSAFTFAGQARSPIEIGTEMQVEYVLDSAVRWQRAGSSAMAVASPQLVRVEDARQIWSAQLEIARDDVADLHVRLADQVAIRLGLAPLPEKAEAVIADRPNREAYELFLRGLQHWHQRSPAGLEAAIDLFIQAIEIDHSYARAYAGLALAYAMMPSFAGDAPGTWMPRGKRAARRALELDPDIPEGHLAMGIIAWNSDLDEAGAGRHWTEALALEPSNPQALLWLAYRSTALRNATEARLGAGRALALDPQSVSTNFDAGMIHWHLRDETEALVQMRRVLKIDPTFTPAAFKLGAYHLLRDELDEARHEWSRIRMFGPSWTALVGHLDDPARAVSAIDRIVELSPRPVHWYAISQLYILFGAPERGLFWVENHLQNLKGGANADPTGGPSLFHVASDPTYDVLRGFPRFQAVVRALGIEPDSD